MKITLLSLFFLLCQNFYAQSFEKLSDFPGESRDDAVAVFHNGYIYAGTGFASGFYPLRDWWRYDVELQDWKQLSDIPFEARQYVAAEATKDYIYLLGGISSSSQFYNDFWRFDPLNNEWTRMADFPGAERWAAKLVAVNGDLYGGLGNDKFLYYDDWYKYNAEEDRWVPRADFIGEGLSKGIAGSLGNTILIGLGRNQDFYLPTFWQYFPETDQWKKVAFELPEALTYCSAAIQGDKLYIMGGQRDDFSYSSLFYEIDLLELSFDSIHPPVNTRRGGSMVSTGEELYLLWGLDENNQRINDFYKINLPADTVRWIEIFPNPVADLLKVNFPEGSDRLEVFTEKGQLFKTFPVGPEEFMFIQTDDFPSQCYFIRICSGNECSEARTICKEE